MDPRSFLDTVVCSDLLRRVASQDAEAFTKLYAHTSEILLGIARSITRDPVSAEDVLQEVYTRIWNKAEAFDPALGKPLAWMIALTRNEALDKIRSSKRREAAMQKLAESPSGELADAARTSLDGNAEIAQLAKEMLARFPPKQRRALELSLLHGFSHSEVAKEIDEPLGTVKAWIRRGIIDLRTSLMKRF